jgi:hypothetical protein
MLRDPRPNVSRVIELCAGLSCLDEELERRPASIARLPLEAAAVAR